MDRRRARSCSLLALATAALATTVAPMFGGAASAPATPAAPVASTAPAQAMNWELDPVHCMAVFRIQHMGAGMFWGKFDEVTGTVSYPEDGSAAPEFNVSVKVDSVATGSDKLNKTLKGPQFFNAKEWDSITFKSTKAEKVGDKVWKVSGDLSLHGVTKPIEAMVEVTGVIGNPVQKKAGFEAVFEINRSDYGMEWGVKNKALGDNVKMVVGLEGDWKR